MAVSYNSRGCVVNQFRTYCLMSSKVNRLPSEPLFLGDQKKRNHTERGLDCMEADREPPTAVLIICSAMPVKELSSWLEWWLDMSLGVISNQNRNDKVSSGSIYGHHHHQKNPKSSTQVQERLC